MVPIADAARLAARRRAAKIPQTLMALIIGVRVETLCRQERGRADMSAGVAARYSAALPPESEDASLDDGQA